jgi:DNA-binding IclR family transcriptional regulator
MATVAKAAKAKAAERVIEVLEFFDEQHRHATVMDIVRRYNRPQSSTSELLASLVDLGLLYKEPGSRSYTLTPRAAILGSLSQPRLVCDGRLRRLIDGLRDDTGRGTALIGMVGPHAQVYRWAPALCMPATSARAIGCSAPATGGTRDSLCHTAAGWLLLSTLPAQRRDGVIRRLNAEAPECRKFSHADMVARVQECGRQGFAIGPAGFGVNASMIATLVPTEPGERPMALGLVCEQADLANQEALLRSLRGSVALCAAADTSSSDTGEAIAIGAMAHAA